MSSIEWCAGFFDGEGTAGCWKANNGRASKQFRRLTAAIAQNTREPLDVFVGVVKAGKVYGPYKSTNGGKEHYIASFNGEEVIALYDCLKDSLLIKRGQLEDAIKAYREYKATVVSGRPRCTDIPLKQLRGTGF